MGHFRSSDPAVHRLDAVRVSIDTPAAVPCVLFAREDVAFEPGDIAQLFEFASLQRTVEALRKVRFFGDSEARLERLVLTPDFHRGKGIPVGTVALARGFVIPGAIGNDICCGMRVLATDVTQDELVSVRPRFEQRLRAIFFGGERDIPFSPRQREALLRDGLRGLVETCGDNAGVGAWRWFDRRAEEAALARTHAGGGFPTTGTFTFADWIASSGGASSRDAQIGSVGGGNHFVELQVVDELVDGATSHDWGLPRGCVTVMAHSGSVGLGHAVGGHFATIARALHPTGVEAPPGGFFVLPTEGPHAAVAARYLDAMRNAANFAFANRLFLALMAVRALSEALGREVEARFVADAPHNLAWDEGDGTYLHRKGACPAIGPNPARNSPFRYTGHPVVVPGSMGDASWILAGCGSEEALESACHGAGRSLPRGKSAHVDDDAFDAAMAGVRVITPIDVEAPAVRLRRDIVEAHRARLKEEAPYAYKPITPVIQTIEEAGMARRVAKLRPLATVKG